MRWLGCVALGLLLLAAGPQAPPAVPSPVQVVSLRNGLHLLLVPDPQASAVDVAVWYDYGSRTERPALSGISHLFEHVMSAGSDHYGPEEHRRSILGQGGTTGAYTAADFACFFETVPPSALELALRLEADRMALTLTDTVLEAQRRVVRDENAQRAASSPLATAIDRLYATAFRAHPYRLPVLGSDSTLARITLADCRAYLAARCTPSHALVTVVGRFDSAQVAGLAREIFEPIASGSHAPDAPPIQEPPQTVARRRVTRDNVSTPLLLVGWRAPARRDPDGPALVVLANILARGSAARLERALVDRKSCVEVQADVEQRRDASLFYAVALLRAGADIAQVERTVNAEIARLVTQRVDDAELQAAKRQVEASMLFGLQTVHGRAQTLGVFQLLDGDAGGLGRNLERVRSLTAADLRRAAARVLVPARRSVVWVMPAPNGGLR